ncbi:uncharacterized protein LOC134711167 isoform X4 [Mytilus trossulus]|uniref:uncharacterized protein LOC134711167 isoform X4 n=1 Tax=Mytilus trossulus TaxID=6551 RepID=UPI003005B88A
MAARHGVFFLLLVIVIQTVESKRKVICENSKTTLSCQSNQVIKIKQATYGRSDKRTCKHPNINTTRCSTNKPLGISRKNCNGRKSCTVSANNGLYGDPCPGTYKYVTVSYSCKDKTPKCLRKCHRQAKCIRGKCVCNSGYKGDGIRSCTNIKVQTPKCRRKCHKKARCIKGKCVCIGKYQGDGIRSCKKAKLSAYIGCYQDDSKRILSKKVLKDKRMTVQKCQQFCGQKGFKYAGVEYGFECFCGNVLRKDRKRKESDCKTPCAGNKRQICGGTWRISIYTVAKTSKCMQKCHTKAKCRKRKCVCKAKYQGDGVKSCKKVKLQTSKCRNKCHKKARCIKGKCVCKGKYQGDGVRSCQKAKPSRKWKCYHYTLANKLAIKLLGQKSICEKHGRKFTKGKNKRYPGCGTCWCCQKAKGKPPKCLQKCHKKAKCRKGKCVCKRKYQGDGVKSCKKMKPSRKWKCYHYTLANKLAIKLYGEKSICERHGRKFTKGKNKRYPGCRTCWCCQKAKGKPSKCRNKCHTKAKCRKGKCVCKSKYQGDGVKSCKEAKKSAYFGCYQDHSKRILPKDVLTDKRMTVQKCRQFCGKKRFKYAGVENGNECFCGDVLRKNKKRKESDCKTPCSGNKQQICGGPWRISIYTAQTSKCKNKCHKKAKCRKGKCVCKGKYQGDGVKSCKKVKPSRKWKCYHYTLANKLAIKLYGEKSICERHGRKFTKGRNKSYPGCRTCWCCQKAKVQTSKCRSKCHKKARCIKGKCVCKGKYQGDGVRSCKKAKPSRKWKCYHYTLANKLAIKLYGEKSICERHGRKFTKGRNKSYPGCRTCWCCQKAKVQTSKCRSKCHKKARCIKGKCVCKGKYQGDGVRSCKKAKPSRKWKCYHYTLANKLAIKLYGEKSICERHGRKFTKGKNKSYPGCRTCWCCQKAKGKPPKCRNKCHKKANCRKGKCVCKSKYQGDGVKSCKKAKKSAYFGCYQDHSKRILPKDVLTYKRMTVQKCRQFCGKKGFKYAGVENGNECFCGDVLRKNKKRKESDCKTPCSGNKQQICGGPWRISIYTVQTSKCRSKCHKNARCIKGKCVCKGKYQGDGVRSCKKATPSRKWKCYHYTLANKLSIKLYGEKSICERHGRKFTKGRNKSYPGCRTCWCCQKAKGKPPKCRNKCHKKANCRKGKCVCKSKYQGDGIKSCKKAKKSAYIGCYQDHSKRILPKDVLTDKSMTVQKCRQFCGKKGFKYAGVENGNECFCGDVLRKNKKRKESDCKTPCSGNKQQICGGPWRISIYTAQTSKCKNKCHKKAKCRKGKCVCKGKYQGDGVKSCKKVKQCRKTAKGTEYKGRISLTQTGRTCQYWERQYPHKHPFSISFKTEHNYCRNPDNSGQPWCYTNDPTRRWEYCQIPMCAPEDPEDVNECRKSAKGKEYKGRISLTQTGRTCQYWKRQYPHKHPFSISFKTEHNYCRNPDNSGQPWCYTNDPTTRWEYCQIPMCAACSVREEIVECKATVRVSGSCFYKSKVGSSCVYTVQLSDSQAIIKTSTQEMVLTNGGNLAECAIFTFNDGTLKIEDDVCKCFEAIVQNK